MDGVESPPPALRSSPPTHAPNKVLSHDLASQLKTSSLIVAVARQPTHRLPREYSSLSCIKTVRLTAPRAPPQAVHCSARFSRVEYR
jgi:hypothetical protein